jgi:hypothetical protein
VLSTGASREGTGPFESDLPYEATDRRRRPTVKVRGVGSRRAYSAPSLGLFPPVEAARRCHEEATWSDLVEG